MTTVNCPKCGQQIKDKSKITGADGKIALGLVCVCDDEKKCNHAFLVMEGIKKEEKDAIEAEQIAEDLNK
jgi:hypothetical protein